MTLLSQERLFSLAEVVRTRWLTLALILAALGVELAVARAVGRGTLDGITYTTSIQLAGEIQVNVLSSQPMNTALLATGAIALIVVSALWWRLGLLLFFGFMPFEGFLSNLFFTTPVPLLLKDTILLGVYAGFALERSLQRKPLFFQAAFNVPLLFFVALTIVQVLNPALPSLLVGMVGLRVTLMYIPLVYVSYHFIGTRAGLGYFLTFLLFLTVPINVIGLVQLALGPEALLNLAPGFARGIFIGQGAFLSPGAHIYRPMATFSHPAHYAGYLAVHFFLALAVVHFRMRKSYKIAALGILLLLLLALLINTQRSLFLVLPAAAAVIFLLQRVWWRSALRAVAILVTALLLAWIVPGQVQLYHKGEKVATQTFSGLDMVIGRGGELIEPNRPYLLTYLTHNIPATTGFIFVTPPLGRGPGSASPASRYLQSGVPLLAPENHYAKVASELGWLGLALFVWVLGGLVRLGWRSYRALEDPDLRWLAVVLATYITLIPLFALAGTILDFSVPASYFWFLCGLLLKLPALDREPKQDPDKRTSG